MTGTPAQAAIAALIATVTASAVGAQSMGTWEIGTQLMTSIAPSSPGEFFGGQASGISQSAVAIRATTDLLRIGPIRLRYSAQLLPAVRLVGVERYTRLQVTDQSIYVLGGQTASYGIGLVPLGIDLSAPLGKRIRVQSGLGIGVVRFTQNVPFAASRQRNFSLEWDGALAINAGADRWVQLGMRWKHISNGFSAYENPGIDSRMAFLGMSVRVRAPR